MARRGDIRDLRVDQVGSLLRPRSLIDAFLAHGRGTVPREELDHRIDAAIRAVVAKQEAIGFPIVTDGEYARISWQVSFARVRGWPLDALSWRNFIANPDMRAADERPNTRGRDAVESFRTPATERLRLSDNVPLAEYRRLAAVAKTPAKAMIMGPDRVAISAAATAPACGTARAPMTASPRSCSLRCASTGCCSNTTPRAGGFEPLRFVPKGGPIVVLGLVTTKTGEVESVASLMRRIDDAQRFIALDQLALSPQCGFASGMAGNDLSEDQQWRKLEVVLETARRVWG